MNTEIQNRMPAYIYLLSAVAGAFFGFMLPLSGAAGAAHGVIAAIVSFELNYLNAMTTFCGLWLLYWLFWRRVSGREAAVMYFALGFAFVRLTLALIRFHG